MKRLFFTLAIFLIALNATAANPTVEIKTNQGVIVVELDPAKAPKSVENFLQYVKTGFYDGTLFHRVIDGFMIQGGGFEAGMKHKDTREPIVNESGNGLKNVAGSIAMARTSDPNSATSQFFINLIDNAFLDQGAGYAVFGKVTQGFDIVQKIGKTPTGVQDMPTTPVIIESVKLLPAKK
jgi:cyclophilin family peptidyl-prolyl cis-trans isomerase